VSRPAWCARRHLESWLRRNGFRRLPNKSTDHAHYELRGHKVTVVTGRDSVSANEATTTVRTLEKLGFDRREVRLALRPRS
jgi:hypothetical protein